MLCTKNGFTRKSPSTNQPPLLMPLTACALLDPCSVPTVGAAVECMLPWGRCACGEGQVCCARRDILARRRIGRLRRVALVARDRRAAKLFTAGLRPAVINGSKVHGGFPTELHRLQLLSTVTMRPSARGRSIRATRLLHGDLAPLDTSLARASATLPVPGCAIRMDALRASWRNARGRIEIAHLGLKRLGWVWFSPFRITNERGECIEVH